MNRNHFKPPAMSKSFISDQHFALSRFVYLRTIGVRALAFSLGAEGNVHTYNRCVSPSRSMKPIEAKRIDLSDKRWHYRGEGNANLVITIPEDGKIIRFAKTKYPDKDQDAKITEIAYFANEVMRPALGSHFVRPLGIGVLGENDFKNVKQEAQKYRPLKRCKKDIQCKKVIWSPDCVFLTKEYATNTKGLCNALLDDAVLLHKLNFFRRHHKY